MSETLEKQRADLEAKLGAVRMAPEAAEAVRKADAAVAAMRAEAAALEQGVAAIDAEMGVRERDRRAAAAEQRAEQWRAQRQALLAEEEVRLTAIADAETAARALVDALNRTFQSNARLAKIAQGLSTTHKVPRGLNANDLVHRMAGRLAGVMQTIKGHRFRLGQLEWPGASLYPATESWREKEEQLLAAGAIQPLLEKGRAE